MEKPRAILHFDLDAFFCAVEENQNPALRGKPFAVGGDPRGRGVVSSCSYPARTYGVHSAMPMARAVKKCPHLIVVSGDHSRYSFYSRKVLSLLRDVTDRVEKISIDEAFLDVSELDRPSREIGATLQSTVLNELNLPNSIGIATNKLVAKIANDVGKMSGTGEGPPNALTVVPPGEEAAFLAPLPVDMLWGVGPKTKARLARLGIETIGELAEYPTLALAEQLGKHGYQLSRRARGIDPRPIVTERETKSVSNERTFRRDKTRRGPVLEEIRRLAGKVSRRLQNKDLRGRTIQIKVRWSDFTTLTRQHTLDHPVNNPQIIFKESQKLFDQVWEKGRPVRLIGVGVSNLNTRARQMGLWDPRVEKDLQLEKTLQALQKKYGQEAISRGFDHDD